MDPRDGLGTKYSRHFPFGGTRGALLREEDCFSDTSSRGMRFLEWPMDSRVFVSYGDFQTFGEAGVAVNVVV